MRCLSRKKAIGSSSSHLWVWCVVQILEHFVLLHKQKLLFNPRRRWPFYSLPQHSHTRDQLYLFTILSWILHPPLILLCNQNCNICHFQQPLWFSLFYCCLWWWKMVGFMWVFKGCEQHWIRLPGDDWSYKVFAIFYARIAAFGDIFLPFIFNILLFYITVSQISVVMGKEYSIINIVNADKSGQFSWDQINWS